MKKYIRIVWLCLILGYLITQILILWILMNGGIVVLIEPNKLIAFIELITLILLATYTFKEIFDEIKYEKYKARR